MFSLLVLDPNPKEAGTLELCIRDWMAFHTQERLEWIAFDTAGQLEHFLESGKPFQAALIDVTAKGGLDGARCVRAANKEAEILLIADASVSPIKYMTPAIRAASLLLRPASVQLLRDICGEFLRFQPFLARAEGAANSFLVENSDGKRLIPFSMIYYFEAREKKIYIRTKSVEYAVYDTLDGLADRLPDGFLRCHRSYIVNMSHLKMVRLQEGMIYLQEAVCVPVSRSYRSSLKEYLHGKV